MESFVRRLWPGIVVWNPGHRCVARPWSPPLGLFSSQRAAALLSPAKQLRSTAACAAVTCVKRACSLTHKHTRGGQQHFPLHGNRKGTAQVRGTPTQLCRSTFPSGRHTHLQKNMHRDTHSAPPLVFSAGIEGSVQTNHSHVFGEGWKECTFPRDTQIPPFASISGAENKWTWNSLPGLGSSFPPFSQGELLHLITIMDGQR